MVTQRPENMVEKEEVKIGKKKKRVKQGIKIYQSGKKGGK